jgi:hypothetical protein
MMWYASGPLAPYASFWCVVGTLTAVWLCAPAVATLNAFAAFAVAPPCAEPVLSPVFPPDISAVRVETSGSRVVPWLVARKNRPRRSGTLNTVMPSPPKFDEMTFPRFAYGPVPIA